MEDRKNKNIIKTTKMAVIIIFVDFGLLLLYCIYNTTTRATSGIVVMMKIIIDIMHICIELTQFVYTSGP